MGLSTLQPLLLSSLLMSLVLTTTAAASALPGPVTNPEAKSSKSLHSATATVQQQQQQQQQQQLQQQQHQQQLKASQEAHLNSLTAYATNYDSIEPTGSGPSLQSQSPLSSASASSLSSPSYNSLGPSHFKPSYKMPEMETNFTPMQGSGPPALGSATPVIMQYLPDGPNSINGGGGSGAGVQYLQLIPTRPLLVPISPYLAPGPQTHSNLLPQAAAYHAPPPQQLQPQPSPHATLNVGGGGASNYGPRAAMLTALPPAPQIAPSGGLIDVPNTLPYGLHSYGGGGGGGSPLHLPYRHTMAGLGGGPVGGGGGHFAYRINREIKDKPQPHLPAGLSLNLNEYLPGPVAHAMYMRGRP